MQGKVLKLYISTTQKLLPRKEQQTLQADPNGIIGDKFYAKDPNRTILLTTIQSYDMAKRAGITLPFGALGENICIDINPYHLLPGDTIEIGLLRLVVTQNCTLCKGLSALDPKLPKLLKDDRGIFTKALNSATIQVGDTVRLFPQRNSQ